MQNRRNAIFWKFSEFSVNLKDFALLAYTKSTCSMIKIIYFSCQKSFLDGKFEGAKGWLSRSPFKILLIFLLITNIWPGVCGVETVFGEDCHRKSKIVVLLWLWMQEKIKQYVVQSLAHLQFRYHCDGHFHLNPIA